MNRRMFFLLGATAVTAAWAVGAARGQETVEDGLLHYRGFTVEVSAFRAERDFEDLEQSIKNQIDIVADSEVAPSILEFFRTRPIALRHIKGDEAGRFDPRVGVEIDAEPQPPEKPILLHELLHAYHFRILPGGFANADVLRFYNIARENRLYPMRGPDGYVLKNVKEYFAVTASAYLWGVVDRPPYSREHLMRIQPHYCDWLGEQFGVQK